MRCPPMPRRLSSLAALLARLAEWLSAPPLTARFLFNISYRLPDAHDTKGVPIAYARDNGAIPYPTCNERKGALIPKQRHRRRQQGLRLVPAKGRQRPSSWRRMCDYKTRADLSSLQWELHATSQPKRVTSVKERIGCWRTPRSLCGCRSTPLSEAGLFSSQVPTPACARRRPAPRLVPGRAWLNQNPATHPPSSLRQTCSLVHEISRLTTTNRWSPGAQWRAVLVAVARCWCSDAKAS